MNRKKTMEGISELMNATFTARKFRGMQIGDPEEISLEEAVEIFESCIPELSEICFFTDVAYCVMWENDRGAEYGWEIQWD